MNVALILISTMRSLTTKPASTQEAIIEPNQVYDIILRR